MRELRVIGLTPDSAHIVCVDTETGVKYRLPADEKLRAAARGDLARFGQIEIETEATMRPRDIQARIRAGASVEQVTEESGMPTSRVERFAYPVLLERARAAELAQKAHPVRKDGPAVETLIDVVSAAFAERGHNIDIAEWDAWKDEKGYWVAQLQWQAGRSVIAAHWRFQPDAHGGSVTPLDDPATDLIDPDFGRRCAAWRPFCRSPPPRPRRWNPRRRSPRHGTPTSPPASPWRSPRPRRAPLRNPPRSPPGRASPSTSSSVPRSAAARSPCRRRARPPRPSPRTRAPRPRRRPPPRAASPPPPPRTPRPHRRPRRLPRPRPPNPRPPPPRPNARPSPPSRPSRATPRTRSRPLQARRQGTHAFLGRRAAGRPQLGSLSLRRLRRAHSPRCGSAVRADAST